MKALVVGGTGPTGPYIIQSLIDRGYEPVIMHRGTHEVDFVEPFEHLHADPHFAEPVAEILGDRRFDLVVATYGRLRVLADVLQDRANRMITVGGTVYARQCWSTPADETAAREVTHKLVARVQETEDAVLAQHSDQLNITHLRYPNLYGPRQLAPREWSVIRRLIDGRTDIPVMDGGLTLEGRAYVQNAAHAVTLAIDNPEVSAGQIYHVSDSVTPTDGERAEAIAAAMGEEIRLVNYPREAARPAYFWGGGRNLESMGLEGAPPTHHKLLDSSRIREDLGYTDLVPFEEAIRTTVQWYLANPLERGGPDEERIGDPFDYEAEDRFTAALNQFVQTCGEMPFSGVALRHSYDHPKGPAAVDKDTTR